MKKLSLLLAITMMISILSGCNIANVQTPQLNIETPVIEETSTVIPGEDLEVYFFDVGQADCILSLLPNGETMLIDAGNNGDGQKLTQQFKGLGVNKIDYLIGTHPHEDHIGGLDDIINNFDIKNIYLPNKSTDTKTFEDVVNAIANKNLQITKPIPGTMIYEDKDLKIKILAPNSSEYNNLNNYSIAIRMDYKDNSFLFTGDGEKEVEDEILAQNFDVDVDVFKAGHHGSTTSNSERFLDKVTPEYTIIQVGEGNEYGHPHDEIIETLSRRNSDIYRTDINGTIKVISDGVNIEVQAERGTNQKISTPQNLVVPQTPIHENTNENVNKYQEQDSNTNNEHIVYVTPNGAKYHEEGCKHLGKNTRSLSVEDAISEGYEPCKGCH